MGICLFPPHHPIPLQVFTALLQALLSTPMVINLQIIRAFCISVIAIIDLTGAIHAVAQ